MRHGLFCAVETSAFVHILNARKTRISRILWNDGRSYQSTILVELVEVIPISSVMPNLDRRDIRVDMRCELSFDRFKHLLQHFLGALRWKFLEMLVGKQRRVSDPLICYVGKREAPKTWQLPVKRDGALWIPL